jgi:hypothetical protein
MRIVMKNSFRVSYFIFEKELCVNVAINIYYARVIILITFAGLFRACKKKAFCRRLVFIVMRLRRDYELSLSMRMDREIFPQRATEKELDTSSRFKKP